MAISNRTLLAIFLVFTGVSAGLLVIDSYSQGRVNAAFTPALLGAAIGCIIAGSILGFSQVLGKLVAPVIDEFSEDIEDDIQDLKERRLTPTIQMALITMIAFFTFAYFAIRFQKLEATWGGLPVVIPTGIGMMIVPWFILRTAWYRNQRRYTPLGVFLIPTIGLLLTIFLGVTNMEKKNMSGARVQEPVAANAYASTGYHGQGGAGIVDWLFLPDLPSCDDDICGAVMMVILLVVLTFVLVAGSATIPHFWFFSGSILLTIMVLIALHDLRVRRSAVGETV